MRAFLVISALFVLPGCDDGPVAEEWEPPPAEVASDHRELALPDPEVLAFLREVRGDLEGLDLGWSEACGASGSVASECPVDARARDLVPLALEIVTHVELDSPGVAAGAQLRSQGSQSPRTLRVAVE